MVVVVYFLLIFVCGVFELPLPGEKPSELPRGPRNAPKRQNAIGPGRDCSVAGTPGLGLLCFGAHPPAETRATLQAPT
jgi:hypothetical protein